MINPGEIYLADLYEAGVRPILIVSRESMNRGGYAVAVPLTSTHFDRRHRRPTACRFVPANSDSPKTASRNAKPF